MNDPSTDLEKIFLNCDYIDELFSGNQFTGAINNSIISTYIDSIIFPLDKWTEENLEIITFFCCFPKTSHIVSFLPQS